MLRVYCILQYALKFFKKIMLKIGEYARIREINKLELNQIAARWPAKAVAQFPFSKKAVTRMSQDSIV